MSGIGHFRVRDLGFECPFLKYIDYPCASTMVGASTEVMRRVLRSDSMSFSSRTLLWKTRDKADEILHYDHDTGLARFARESSYRTLATSAAYWYTSAAFPMASKVCKL